MSDTTKVETDQKKIKINAIKQVGQDLITLLTKIDDVEVMEAVVNKMVEIFNEVKSVYKELDNINDAHKLAAETEISQRLTEIKQTKGWSK